MYKLMTVALATLLALGGCATTKNTQTNASKIDTWLHVQVLPDMQKKLSTLPKFKGQPLMVVGIDDGNLATQNNDLIKSLQRQVINKLLTSPQILLTNPGTHNQQPLTDLSLLKCGLYQDADVFIGIDSNKDINTGKLRVTIKAYDAHDQLRFLSGLSYEFEDSLNEHYLNALKIDSQDNSIKGSRRFPFDETEADSLANNLSHQLACLLSQSAKDKVVLYPVVNENDSTYSKTTISLVSKALSNYKQISLTNNKADANTLLSLTSHSLGLKQRLSLVTADLANKENILIGGASAKAYVRNPLISSFTAPSALKDNFAFTSFEILTPTNMQQCTSNTPWVSGENKLQAGSKLNSGSCFALEAATNKAADIFLIYQTPSRAFQRMLPTQCSLFTDVRSTIDAYDIVRYPAIDGKVKAIDLGSRKGEESFFMIAVNSSEAKALVESRLNEMVDFCDGTETLEPDNSSTKKALHIRSASDIESWLSNIGQKFPGQLIWQKKSFLH
jgi:hypothetical protein